MNNKVPAYYPEVPEEVLTYLKEIDGVIVPQCIEGKEIKTRIGDSAFFANYAVIENTLFTVYLDKKDCWEDAYYDAWYLSEDKQDEKLLTDLAILNVKNIDWWVV